MLREARVLGGRVSTPPPGVTARAGVTRLRPRMTTGRDALLAAFDRLFDAAAKKLNVACTPEERQDAKQQFVRRFEGALELVDRAVTGPLPEPTLEAMVEAIEKLSPADLVGAIASVPLAQQTQEMLRAIAFRQAEQRLLEHFAAQADTRYGGN